MGHRSAVSPLREMPVRLENAVTTLDEIFELTPAEYVVLTMCVRDDKRFLYGLDPMLPTPAQRETMADLIRRALIEFSPATDKWELTQAGRVFVREAPVCAQNLETVHGSLAEVVELPRR